MPEQIISLLLVDDDESFLTVLVDVLSSLGSYHIETSESGEHAVELMKQKRYDVVILDYKMPGMTGLNVLQWMHEEKIETPVLMLTGAGSEIVATEAMKFGAYDYVRKEHIEVEHLPIIINGIFERYLFRKEKEQREQREKERAKHIASVETFQATVTSIVLILKNTLSVISLNLDEYEQELKPYVTSDGQKRFTDAMAELRQEFSTVSSGLKSLESLADMLYQKFTSMAPISKELHETQNLTFKAESGEQKVTK
jgi:CheY-like chemotaxis protein